MEPLDANLQGKRTFVWQPNFALGENQAFELVFWVAGADPMASGFGPVGYTTANAVTVDLEKTADVIPHLFASGRDYRWGVLLVEREPYRRIQYLGGNQPFRFERAGGGGSGGGGDSPTATPVPDG
ncbi:MAG: hypothetical protein IPK16_28550 [Anaerolineales bacterium]|nr:hypothetical protein [Anaerolineales bacterium]